MKKINTQKLADKWPSSIVARSEVGKFSGGLISPQTLANRNCLKLPPHPIKVGKKAVYEVDDLCRYFEELQEGQSC